MQNNLVFGPQTGIFSLHFLSSRFIIIALFTQTVYTLRNSMYYHHFTNIWGKLPNFNLLSSRLSKWTVLVSAVIVHPIIFSLFLAALHINMLNIVRSHIPFFVFPTLTTVVQLEAWRFVCLLQDLLIMMLERFDFAGTSSPFLDMKSEVPGQSLFVLLYKMMDLLTGREADSLMYNYFKNISKGRRRGRNDRERELPMMFQPKEEVTVCAAISILTCIRGHWTYILEALYRDITLRMKEVRLVINSPMGSWELQHCWWSIFISSLHS